METNKFYNHILFRVGVSTLQGMYLGLILGWWGLFISIPVALALGYTAD